MHHSQSRGGTLRTFIAIELDDQVLRALAAVQSKLEAALPPRSVRWVRPEGIHLTLKFLGDTPAARLEEVQRALAAAAARVAPFSFSVEGLGCFPNPRRPRVIWVGVKEPTGALARLWQAVEAEVAPLGWPTEARGFQPHLTLGRVQRHVSSADLRALGELVEKSEVGRLGSMTVRAVSFIRSDLKPTGAVYTTLAEAHLGGGAGETG
ncbi:MAG: RNA 2',3'-cyclic phosphodiesterase [Anaerolineae bacterium]|nr:RNA 2',3'-cyclic phosphodiesterase [Anaerolineae bacterium]